MLPDGMKIMIILGKLFTGNWMMQGMETFFLNVVEDPEFVELLYDKICSLQWEVFERVIDHPAVGGVWNPDDFSGRKSTMLEPDHFRKYCFPTYKKMGQVCRQLGKPMILHSDGNIWALLDDAVDACFDGIHPVEAKAMDIFDVKRAYGDRLALIGNVDLDMPLSRGTPEEVEAEVRRLISGLAPEGRFLISAGNSVPEYVPLPNYKALLHASHRYGKYPITI
jgi:uroporphyrinogen decarboxylase